MTGLAPVVSITLSGPFVPTIARTSAATSTPGPELIVWVAPRSRAIASLLSSTSTAITGLAPARLANWTTGNPTPPEPNTTTDSPTLTFASLVTTPAAVVTAQPKSGATLRSVSAGITVMRFSETMAYSLNVVTQPAFSFSPRHR